MQTTFWRNKARPAKNSSLNVHPFGALLTNNDLILLILALTIFSALFTAGVFVLFSCCANQDQLVRAVDRWPSGQLIGGAPHDIMKSNGFASFMGFSPYQLAHVAAEQRIPFGPEPLQSLLVGGT
jgi:hypothetical protein